MTGISRVAGECGTRTRARKKELAGVTAGLLARTEAMDGWMQEMAQRIDSRGSTRRVGLFTLSMDIDSDDCETVKSRDSVGGV